jgi:hypothetical protein
VGRALFAAGAAALALAGAAHASPISRENARAGSTGWNRPLASGTTIEGYATKPSAVAGQRIELHVSTQPAARYRVEIYRLGWYGGTGGRLVACLPSCTGDEQGTAEPYPVASTDPTGPVLTAGWPMTDSIAVPASWLSGYYDVRFVLTSGPGAGTAAETFVIVREPAGARPSLALVQVPVNTWEAYNAWGNSSLYDFHGPRKYRVSFERPYGVGSQTPRWYELQLVHYLEREGVDVSYQTDLDTSNDPASLLQHRLVIVNGHDEYWTKQMRDGFARALATGTNLAFIGSNDGYWQVRYEDGGQTIESWKSLYDPEPVQRLKTAMFREIGRPECQLTGIEHIDIARNYTGPISFSVTQAASSDPWFAGTGFEPGDSVAGIVGREYDTIAPWGACAHPTTVVLFHYAGTPQNPPADAVRWTASSGARVFAAGAQRFSWGLDAYRSNLDAAQASVPVDPRLQRFTENVLNDLSRPAPPVSLSFRRRGRSLVVLAGHPVDPRATAFVAAAWDGRRWHHLCRGTVSCSAPLPRFSTAKLRVGAVEVDRWGRSSAASYVVR